MQICATDKWFTFLSVHIQCRVHSLLFELTHLLNAHTTDFLLNKTQPRLYKWCHFTSQPRFSPTFHSQCVVCIKKNVVHSHHQYSQICISLRIKSNHFKVHYTPSIQHHAVHFTKLKSGWEKIVVCILVYPLRVQHSPPLFIPPITSSIHNPTHHYCWSHCVAKLPDSKTIYSS